MSYSSCCANESIVCFAPPPQSTAWHDSFLCAVTYSYEGHDFECTRDSITFVWHDSSYDTFTCVTRLIHTRHAASICVTCAPLEFLYSAYTLLPKCDMTRSSDTFTCVTRLIHTRHAASICVTCAPLEFLYSAYTLLPKCDMTRSNDTFTCVTRLIHTRHAASMCAWHELHMSFHTARTLCHPCVTWLIPHKGLCVTWLIHHKGLCVTWLIPLTSHTECTRYVRDEWVISETSSW